MTDVLEAAPDVDVSSPSPSLVGLLQGDSESNASSSTTCSHCAKTFASARARSAHERWCVKRLAESIIPGRASKEHEDVLESKPESKHESKPAKRESKPKLAHTSSSKRHSAAGLLGAVWSNGAKFVPSIPAQRAMVWQAPGAGRILDNALAGSFVDRLVLQKITGAESKYKPLLDLVSLPVMLVMLEKQPAMYPVLLPALQATLRANLEAALDAAAAQKHEDERLQAKAAAAGLEWEQVVMTPDGPQTVSIIDSILADLLAPQNAPVQTAPPAEEPQQ